MYIKEAVQIGPSMARKMLERNHPHNRKMKPAKIKGYVADMKAGKWRYPTAEFIKFDEEGNLIDGQNRLQAVIDSESSQVFDVAYDLPADAKLVIDSGASRSYGDALAWRGIGNRNNVGVLVRWVLAWEAGLPLLKGSGASFTFNEMEERRLKEPLEFIASTQRGLDLSRQGVANAGAAATAHFLLSHVDKEATEALFDSLVSGLPVASVPTVLDQEWKSDHPVLSLRNRLLRGRKRDSRQEELALFMRGWNAWREGRTLRQVLVNGSAYGLTNENFPKPV